MALCLLIPGPILAGNGRLKPAKEALDRVIARKGGDDYAYGRDGLAYTVTDAPPSPDGCALAESSIYMPDGQVQKRFIRVCRDHTGRYQEVE